MSEKNKAILEEGNAATLAGNNKGFLAFCADDTEWTFVGDDKTLKRKEAVRQYTATAYAEPPVKLASLTCRVRNGDSVCRAARVYNRKLNR